MAEFDNIPLPMAVEQSNVETILGDIVNYYRTLIPAWFYDTGDPAYGALATLALREFILRQRLNSIALEFSPVTASGNNLDAMGVLVGVGRHPGESDDSYRNRIVLNPLEFSVGTRSAFQANTLNFRYNDFRVTDYQLTPASNREDVVIYAQSNEVATGIPTSAFLAAMAAYMNADSRKIMGQTIFIHPVTRQQVYIRCNYTYTELNLDTSVSNALTFSSAVGGSVYVSQLIAGVINAGATSATITISTDNATFTSNDIAGVLGQVLYSEVAGITVTGTKS